MLEGAGRCWRERNREVPGGRRDAGGSGIDRCRESGEMLEGAEYIGAGRAERCRGSGIERCRESGEMPGERNRKVPGERRDAGGAE